MRKKERFVTNGVLGLAFVFIILDGLSQYLKLKEEGKPFLENLDIGRSIKSGACGVMIGGGLGYLLYEIQRWDEKDLPFCPDNHLHGVLNTHSSQSDSSFVSKAKKLTDDLKKKLFFEFEADLIEKPLDFGSAKTKTAIGGCSDFDILLPFRKESGPMTELYEETYRFIEEEYSDSLYSIRKQRHSIGLTYDDRKSCIHIDIVPSRERNNFYETGDVTILRNKKRFWETPTHIKSNIWKKRRVVVNQPETRKIIKLMKVYRNESNLHLKSPVVLTLVKEAMEKNKGFINSSVYNNWTLAMAYVADQLQTRTQIIDIANSNNNLLETMSTGQKDEIVDLIFSDLERLEHSPSYLKEIFEI